MKKQFSTVKISLHEGKKALVTIDRAKNANNHANVFESKQCDVSLTLSKQNQSVANIRNQGVC
jgi:hypothetical protein